jgi:hypothetical protein
MGEAIRSLHADEALIDGVAVPLHEPRHVVAPAPAVHAAQTIVSVGPRTSDRMSEPWRGMARLTRQA